MTDSRENYISMVMEVLLHYSVNFDALKAEALIFETLAGLLNDEVENYFALQGIAIRILTGYAADKKAFRLSLEEKLLIMISAFISLKMSEKNKSELDEIRQTASDLKARRDVNFLIFSGAALKKFSPFDTNLIDHGLTLAEAGEGTAAREAYKAYIAQPGYQRMWSKSNNEESEKSFERLRGYLEQSDAAHETVKTSQSLLYLSNKNCRAIIDNISSSGAPPDYTPTIEEGTNELIFTKPYNATRRIKVKNLSATLPLLLYMSTEEATMTNPPRLLNPGATSILLSSTLGPNGDHFFIQNLNDDDVNAEVWVFE